ESFGPTASLCHGFSASPTYQLSRRVLGVYPARPGFEAIGIAPDLAGLDHAQGVVPTAKGDVEVELERTKEGFVARARVPDGSVAEFADAPSARLARASAKGAHHEAHYIRG
ncbi:MAG: hypothetical protein JOZ55_11345, partial [Alphaproteobacteria bacterium]|nr:hypothetical protein [Alphaproteobacteria bacterium]